MKSYKKRNRYTRKCFGKRKIKKKYDECSYFGSGYMISGNDRFIKRFNQLPLKQKRLIKHYQIKKQRRKMLLVNEKYDKELDVYVPNIQYSRRKSMNDKTIKRLDMCLNCYY